MTEYVLIYNGSGVGPKSRDDLKKLFEEYNIYPSVDIRLTNFTENLDGLEPEKTTIVLPGGTVFGMSWSLKHHKAKIHDFFERGCNGVFICAGAYLATNNADVYEDSYTRGDVGEFNPLPYGVNFSEEMNLNIVSDYQAVGPFIPHDAYSTTPPTVNLGANVRKPYSVTLFDHEFCAPFSEIYAGGPGFKPITEQANERYEVLATYHDRSSYSFFQRNKSVETIRDMPAMIRAKDRGLFLSATHIETCVEDSQLLKLMQEGDKVTIPLPDVIDYDPASARERVIPLLQNTLKRLTPAHAC
ncbi:MAG: hypothetical protein P1U36_10250 [Legionellaceae bacterium]|nr:hypothetical protein [Legionellaceae bacterium]